ncbi:helix-turn-helix domain-containing protein [Riemerella anatipestifer]|uniref:Helix-turn-helix domain-containing protein n=1 Tax=Riemerella anatipestifer TaxID=34085 RepID=A0A1S7DQD0_RIEAN|nr:helix-turn-helix transcriptional regulator [Riemerella anatipestifer]AQY21322.1 helix-turn-helix domain-containing protein [Riemerella anatipestifer]
MIVKQILKDRGMTAKELAEGIGMSEVGLSIALSEKGNPSLSTLKKIAEILGISVAELFGGNGGDVMGFVEYKGVTYKIKSFEDLQKILDLRK